DLGLPGAERRGGMARGLRRLLLERHGRVVRRGRARRGPPPRPVPPGGRASLLAAGPRPARRHRAGRDDQSAAALRDRPAEPLLHPGRRRPAGPAGGERQAHRVPLQGHGLLLDDQRGRPQARRCRLVLPAGRRRLRRRQRLPVVPARRPDGRGRRARQPVARARATAVRPLRTTCGGSPDYGGPPYAAVLLLLAEGLDLVRLGLAQLTWLLALGALGALHLLPDLLHDLGV